MGYRWGKVSELRSEIVPYGCSWVFLFWRERPCIGSRGHETHRVGGVGSSVVPDLPVTRWIEYRLENDPYTPIGESLWGLSFPGGMGGRAVCDGGLL